GIPNCVLVAQDLRNSDQLNRIVAYIEGNPVSAGLVDSAEPWPCPARAWQAKPPALALSSAGMAGETACPAPPNRVSQQAEM
ncbi:MAG: hypothetical protein M1541_04025, partial [Acidobacteria bacterium]|nr:hypothetical protein [Acidobacteriota bacterium]